MRRRVLRGRLRRLVMALVLFALAAWQIPGLAARGHALFGHRIAAALDSLAVALAQKPEPKRIAPSVLKQIEELLREKASRTPEQEKIDSKLLYAMKERRGEPVLLARNPRSRIAVREDGYVTVDIRLKVHNPIPALKRLEPLGVQVINKAGNHIRADVPIDRLEEIAADREVAAIRPPSEAITSRMMAPAGTGVSTPRPTKAEKAAQLRSMLAPSLARVNASRYTPSMMMAINVSEGDVTHRAKEAREFFGIDGSGVKIGVIANGVTSLPQVQATGDLPANVTVLPGQDGFGHGDEGTAMLEVIHDLAPAAELYFASDAGGEAVFAQNLRNLRAVGCDIIVDSTFYETESPFQDGQAPNVVSPTNGGLPAQAVRDVIADGALYFSAAGDWGNLNDGTSGTWEGNFKGNGTITIDLGFQEITGVVHDFGDGGQSNLMTGSGFFTTLHWSDPLGASSNDYDLFIFDSDMTFLWDFSTNVQNGDDDPFESCLFGFFGFRIVVVKKSGSEDRYLRIRNFEGQLELATPGAVAGHGTVAGAFSVAATPAAGSYFGLPTHPVGPFPDPYSTANVTELFSADGPRQLFYNPDGTPITPGNILAGGGEIRQKPDITAADGVSIVTPFRNPYFGTSAAAAHAAAIAALLLSANPSLTPDQVRTALTSSALDIEAPGVDRDSGAGIVMAYQALQAIGAQPGPNLKVGAITPTVVEGDEDSDIEPCEIVDLSVELNNVGPAPATMLSATLASKTIGAVVTSNSSAYPDIPVSGSATNTMPFRVVIGCGALCGTPLEFELTVTYAGALSPKVLSFTVTTGTIASAPQIFSYTGPPVPIPDVGPPVTATIDVSGLNGAIADINFRFDGSVCSTALNAPVGLNHSWVSDLVIKLTSPSGTEITLINRAGGNGRNFCQTELDDEAVTLIQLVPRSLEPFTGTFKPANLLSAFDGEDPNGTWTLSVQDLTHLNTGTIRAFSLIITTAECNAPLSTPDLSLTKSVSTPVAIVGDQITYTLTVANNHPGAATNVVVTDVLPPQVEFVSCNAPPDGVCGGTGNNRTITFASIPGAESRTITLVAKVIATGSFTNTATAVMDEEDPTPGDTTAVSGAVQAFDVCLQDDSNANVKALINSTTGAYQFCINGIVHSGTGTLSKSGGTITVTHNSGSRRVTIKVESAVKRGTASFKDGPTTCSITDRNITNNTCACAVSP